MGNKKLLKKSKMFELIDLFEDSQCLYKVKYQAHNYNGIRQKQIEEICKLLLISIEEFNYNILHLKNKFFIELNKLKTQNKKSSKWVYYRALRFLKHTGPQSFTRSTNTESVAEGLFYYSLKWDFRQKEIPQLQIIEHDHCYTTRNVTVDVPYVHTCHFCGQTFNTNRSLVVHARTHTGERPFKCDHCKKTFSNNSTLKIHIRIHYQSVYPYHIFNKPYKCRYCWRSFNARSNLSIHARIHKQEKPYQCYHCLKMFTQKSTMIAHKKQIHLIYSNVTNV